MSLAADTLLIEPDHQRCSLIWRGNVALESLDALQGSQFFAGIEMPGYPMAWPELPTGLPAPSPIAASATRLARTGLPS